MTNPKYNSCEIHTTLNSIERIEELSFECGLQTGSYFQIMCLLESLQSIFNFNIKFAHSSYRVGKTLPLLSVKCKHIKLDE